MIQILVSIIATILTLVFSFVAGYIIYLSSYQSNIDEKISIEGQKIAAEVFKVNYFVPSTTIIIPERYHETGVTSVFQRFLTSFAISFS